MQTRRNKAGKKLRYSLRKTRRIIPTYVTGVKTEVRNFVRKPEAVEWFSRSWTSVFNSNSGLEICVVVHIEDL